MSHKTRSGRFCRRELGHFVAGEAPLNDYVLMPFRFDRLADRRERLVNEVGESWVAPEGTVLRLVNRELSRDGDIYQILRSKNFVVESVDSPQLDVIATKYRTKSSHLDEFTQLHMFVVTLRCDQACSYCQVSRVNSDSDRSRFDMSVATADRALAVMFNSPAKHLVLEFQGGEPSLNFPVVEHLVRQGRRLAQAGGKDLKVVLTSNSASLSERRLEFMREHDVCLSTSLDGPEELHNRNRPRSRENGYALAVDGIERARQVLGMDRVHALMTTSKSSLEFPIEIVDEYVRLGFRSIFLRKLNPYGFALRSSGDASYTTEEFLQFYQKALDYIISLNLSGIRLEEVFATILLTKILTPFPTSFVDLQSPSGAGIKCAIYNYDGNVFASDESRMLSEMGDKSFLLGNVHKDGYLDIFGGQRIRSLASVSVSQSLPGCSDCAYMTYCGADPVRNFATQRDVFGHRPTSDFCQTNLAIIRHLFELMETRPEVEPVFLSWVGRNSLSGEPSTASEAMTK